MEIWTYELNDISHIYMTLESFNKFVLINVFTDPKGFN